MKINLTEDYLDITAPIAAASDADFDKVINTAMAKIQKFSDITWTEDSRVRAQKINDLRRDKRFQDELAKEDQAVVGKKLEPNQRIIRGADKSIRNIQNFAKDLLDTIKEQVGKIEAEEDSWGALNRRFQNTPILKPGVIRDEKNAIAVPVIQAYFDCSSSFDANDIAKERDLLSVLNGLEAQNKIKIELYYFSNNVYSVSKYGANAETQARNEGGTAAWHDIIANIKATAPTNIILCTDEDMNSSAKRNTSSYYAPGCVWFLWKDTRAPEILTRLRGRSGGGEYAITW